MRQPAIDAPGRVQAAVQMNHILATGPLMKVINILSHYRQLGHMLGKFSDSTMCPVWQRLDYLIPTPLVPTPA
jgi:hypothetical protein